MAKRIWNKQELTIAYYIAKWDYNGLNVSENELVDAVIGNTTKQSLNMQVANFRHLLGIDGYVLKDASKAMKKLIGELNNKTVTQVRAIVSDAITSSDANIRKSKITRNNQAINTRKDELNSQSQIAFESKVKALKKHRNLTPVKK